MSREETEPEIMRAVDAAEQMPFIEHLYELRRRLFYIAASVIVGAGAAYAIQQRIVAALLKPARGQHFIYTSPGGGIDFLFKVCIYTGIAVSIPVIIYQFLRYIEPIFPKRSAKFIYFGTFVSGLLALAGVSFGYFIGLPSALNFLLHQFVTNQIQALVTVQAYMSFVIIYMLGSALMFQLPLILIFINRIKPLKPKKLIHYERWVILGAFVVSGLMNPTPHLWAQLLVAGPIILMYQVSIGLIALINRPSRRAKRAEVVAEVSPPIPEPELIPVVAAHAPVVVQIPIAEAVQPVRRPGIQLVGGQRLISDFFVAPKAS